MIESDMVCQMMTVSGGDIGQRWPTPKSEDERGEGEKERLFYILFFFFN